MSRISDLICSSICFSVDMPEDDVVKFEFDVQYDTPDHDIIEFDIILN